MPSQKEKKVLPFYQDTGYGFSICGSFDMDAFQSALAYEPRPDDLFIVTYPKCGTTWVQNIVACIYREGKPFTSALEFLSNTPFLEMAGAEAAKTMKRPGAIKLHLPFHLSPWSPKSKYIFIARNPKDCCVSFYHHTKNIVGYKFKNGSFGDYFELFMDGKVDFGDYFDTLISWYEHRNDLNVLFITYEDLTKNTRENILKIAEFMGQKYKDMLTEDESILNDVIKHSSFDFMKQTLNRQVAELASLPRDLVLNHPDLPQGIKTLLTSKDSFFDLDPNSITFVRKGIVGDYKNHFSAEQNRRLEEKFSERTKGTTIPDLWKDIMMSSHEEKKVSPFYQDTGCGFKICGSFDIEAFKTAIAYKPQPDDIFIVTYPKCGTTWVQNIVSCIFRKGKHFSSAEEFNNNTPFLETAGAKAVEVTTRQCGIKTHLPFHLVPWSPQTKYIFVARNPKDCCVSFYHHTKSILGYKFENGNFDDYFELFIEGKVDYGDYFDTLISWYEHRKDPNVLFMIYEDLKKDTRKNILKVAEFMGEKYKDMLTKDEKILNDVIKHSSFDFMKQQGFFESDPDSVAFARKGIVGDYRKNHLSPEQNRRLEEKFWERTKGTDITELWKDIIMPFDEEKKVLPFYQDTGYGFNICGSFDMNAFKSALNYEPRPDDLFIVTYPKCGTTWVQNIVACIYKEGKTFASAMEFLSNTPFLEMTGAEAAKTMKRPGAIKLHLPFHLTPWSPKAKYIFVARNPKDCCVSFYHHTRNIIGYKFKNGKFDDYFELFMDGKVDFGDYFDTLVSWYEHRNDPNVLFLTYEDLKKDTKGNVLKIAEFMGEKYKAMLTKDEKILNDVINHSSFEFMKQSLNRQMAELATLPKDFVLNHPDVPQGIKTLLTTGDGFFDSDPNTVTFVRKGIIGDYKNHLSPEQNRRLEEKFIEKTKGTDIPELWKDIMTPSNALPFMPSAKPFTQIVDGFPLPGMLPVDCYRSALGYKPLPDDVFIVTYPKCGTTWAQHILLLIFRQGIPLTSQLSFFATTPFLEMAGAEEVEKMPRSGAIKSHLPHHLIPLSSQAKYIYITRNPKDCCVSYFHHMRMPAHGFIGTFDEFLEFFISGDIDYGDYFDHVLGWYAHRNDPNVLFLTYEQMKENPEETVLKMASFIDDKKCAEPLRNDPEKLKNVIQYSSFKYMKEVVNNAIDEILHMSKEDVLNSELPDQMKAFFAKLPSPLINLGAEGLPKTQFVRKGIIGDWKNYFTEDQSKRLDEKFAEKTKGTDIPDLWRKYM